MGGSSSGEMGWRTRVLRPQAPFVTDGVEFSVRYRSSSRTDHDVPATNGSQGASDLRPELRRTLILSWCKKNRRTGFNRTMKAYVIALLALTALTSTSPARSQTQQIPKDWSVTFFGSTKYRGANKTIARPMASVESKWARARS